MEFRFPGSGLKVQACQVMCFHLAGSGCCISKFKIGSYGFAAAIKP